MTTRHGALGTRRRLGGRRIAVAAGLLLALTAARADAVADLRQFVRGVRTGSADFTQVVTSPDGAKSRTSVGHFEFERPNRFRFSYDKPDEQLIVGDGQDLWLYDPELQQVTRKPFSAALGATPAALLSGGPSVERDFELRALPAAGGLDWVEALPKAKDTPFQSLKVGFRGGTLAALDILDAFGQRSRLTFGRLQPNIALAPERFVFKPPPGTDVIRE